MKQIPLAIGPEPARTFDNFLPGANAGALAHLQALAPGAPPVYLWGPEGSGKTHLLHAVVERAERQGQHAAWFNAATACPWNASEEREWIVIDDAQALDPERQHAAFSLFVDATARGAVVVSAGSVPPVVFSSRTETTGCGASTDRLSSSRTGTSASRNGTLAVCPGSSSSGARSV